MSKRKSWALIVLLIFFASAVSFYFQTLAEFWNGYEVDHHVRKLLHLEEKNPSVSNKMILLWTSFFGNDWFYWGNSGHFESCPRYNNCVLTRSRELLNVQKIDAILFHEIEVNQIDIPQYRDPKQKYIFVNIESPKNRPLQHSFLENYFNMTMTYRLDSDILWPYYVVRDIATGEMMAPLQNVKWIEPSYNFSRLNLDLKFVKKTKMAAWLVSNCETYGKRELFVRELEKVVQVDRIGKCGETMIPDCKKSTAKCFSAVIEPQYFFYLSFENTLCQDYVTEKFFNALSHDVIPVVYGGANYSLFAPPHSYIDALDFDCPKALGNFLIELSQNREEYLKYFWWKRFYTVGSSKNWTLCNLCEQLNKPREPKTYSPMSEWFRKDKCPMQDHMNGHEHATKALRFRVDNKKFDVNEQNDLKKGTTNNNLCQSEIESGAIHR